MSQPLEPVSADLGFALVRSEGAWGGRVIVRIVDAQKRFTYVETVHADPADRMRWRETTRGLWTFPTQEAAQAELDKLREVEREWLAKRRPFAPERLAA